MDTSYTLIADRDACRVWAVDSDYKVVWQYGVTGEKGLAANHLMDPFYARYSPEDGGTVLIADNLNGCRVIEVRYSDYQAGAPDNGFTAASITWSYGEPGVSGNGPGQLCKPHSAQRLASGNVLICDAGDDVIGARVLEIDRASGASSGSTASPGRRVPATGTCTRPTSPHACPTATRSSPTHCPGACCA